MEFRLCKRGLERAALDSAEGVGSTSAPQASGDEDPNAKQDAVFEG